VHHSDGKLNFLNQQLDIFRKQADAVNSGDLITAKTTGVQLKRSMKALVDVVCQYRKDRVYSISEKQTVERMVSEMKVLHESALKQLKVRKSRLAELLFEFRKGKNLLSGYHSGRRTGSRLFDMAG